MKKLVSTLNLPREDWLRHRKQGIGGSDAGAICGFNPYRTAMQVYYDKTADEIEDIDNEAMKQGRELEDYIAQRFAKETGKKVRRANAMFYDEKHSFMIADVDRMIVGENAGLECKTVSPYMAEYRKDNQIPLSYQMQCYHYMSVCNADRWYVAALIYGREFKIYTLERDDEIIANLIQLEEDFWNNHVQKRILPNPDGSKLADSVIAEYFKESSGAVIQLQGFDDKLKRREELVVLMDKMESEKRQIEQELKMYMGDAEKAENNLFRVSWKAVVSHRLDAKALQEQEPEVYQKFLKQTSSRRFTVKAA